MYAIYCHLPTSVHLYHLYSLFTQGLGTGYYNKDFISIVMFDHLIWVILFVFINEIWNLGRLRFLLEAILSLSQESGKSVTVRLFLKTELILFCHTIWILIFSLSQSFYPPLSPSSLYFFSFLYNCYWPLQEISLYSDSLSQSSPFTIVCVNPLKHSSAPLPISLIKNLKWLVHWVLMNKIWNAYIEVKDQSKN